MDGKLQRRVQRYGWDRASTDYERSWAEQLRPAQECLLGMADLQLGEKVVDIACGTGLVTFPVAEAVGEEGEIVGTDLSGAMVELVSGEAERLGLRQARFERMGAEELELEDGAFDAAVCALGLMYVPSPLAAVTEMLRVLRPGGRAVAAVWGGRDRCGWAEIFPIVDSRVRSEVCPMFFQLGTGETLTMLFEQVGFVDVQTERLSTVLEYEGRDDALGAAFAGGPVAMAYSRFDEATKEVAHAEYLQSIEPYRNGTGYRVPGEFVVVAGRKGE